MKLYGKKYAVSLLWAVIAWTGVFASEPARDPALLFEVTFDGYSVTADYAKGDPKSTTFANPGLQLRMWEGVAGKGNALAMDRTEECQYNMKDNLDPRQGTVSLWVAPLNWKTGNQFIEVFFGAGQKDFTIYIQKYLWSNHLFFYLENQKAPGTKKTFTAAVLIDEKDWGNNQWHKLDAVWDCNGMKLYVDGVLPKTVEWRNPELKFDTAMTFPEPAGWGWMSLGKKSDGADKNHRTAYDNLRIYNRPLSAKEINDEYLKYFTSKFGSERLQQVVSVPKAAGEVTLDGKINPAEWSDAAAVPVREMTGVSINRKQKINGAAHLKHDGKNLYVAFFCDAPSKRFAHTVRDGNLWEDDSFEFFLYSPARKVKYQFIINSNGVIFDQKNGQPAWNAGAKAAAFRGRDFWSAEFELPLADIGGFNGNDDWTGNFYISSYLDELGSFAWAVPEGYYDSPKSFGKILFRNDPVFAGIRSLGNLPLGQMDLAAERSSNAVKFKAFYELENGSRTDYNGEPADMPWQVSLPVGRQRLAVSAVDASGRALYQYETYYYVNYPLELQFDCRPQEKRIAVSVDANNAGTELLKRIQEQGIPGVVRLLSEKQDKVYSTQSFTARQNVFSVFLPLPDGLTEGNYWIEAKLDGSDSLVNRIRFRVPDMTPYEVKVSVDHTVPPPWTPVVKANDRTFRVLDREYRFDGGPFPVQIVSRGSDMLIVPPVLTADGAKVVWTDFKVGEQYPDYIELSGKGAVRGFTFTWKGQLWFDGMYLVDWDMTPVRIPEQLSALTLSWKIPAEYSRYVFKQNYNDGLEVWKNDRIEREFNPVQNVYNNLLWTSGLEKGLAWHPKSNANWANHPGEKNIILIRDAEEVSVTAKIISRPVEVKTRLWYTMVFQGTPSRSPIKGWRDHNYGGYQVPTMQNLQFGGGGDHTFADYQTDQRWLTPSSHKPRWMERYLNYTRKSKEKREQDTKSGKGWKTKSHIPYRLINYVMPFHVGTNEAEYDYFFNDWVTLPTTIWGYKEDGVPQTIYSCCGQTGITDAHLYNLERLFKINPLLGGMYNDCPHSKVCENVRHGCGGVDAFGQKYRTSTMLGQREFMMREYKLIRKYGKTLVNHVPAADIVPFVHNFSDHVWPGEEFHGGFGKNPDYFYCEGVTREAWQSTMSPMIRGISVILLPQPERAAGNFVHLKSRRNDFLTNPEWAIRTMTPCLLHDVGITPDSIEKKTVDRWWIIKDQIKLAGAEFHGYWFDSSVRSASPNVYASWYELPAGSPYRYLIVAGNLGRDNRKLALAHTLPNVSSYYDLWNGKAMTMSDLQNTLIPGNHFALIGVK